MCCSDHFTTATVFLTSSVALYAASHCNYYSSTVSKNASVNPAADISSTVLASAAKFTFYPHIISGDWFLHFKSFLYTCNNGLLRICPPVFWPTWSERSREDVDIPHADRRYTHHTWRRFPQTSQVQTSPQLLWLKPLQRVYLINEMFVWFSVCWQRWSESTSWWVTVRSLTPSVTCWPVGNIWSCTPACGASQRSLSPR